MSTLATIIDTMKFNRDRTLKTLSTVEEEPRPACRVGLASWSWPCPYRLAVDAHRHYRRAVRQRSPWQGEAAGVCTNFLARFKAAARPTTMCRRPISFAVCWAKRANPASDARPARRKQFGHYP